MADFDPTKDGITPARPTPSATPAQKAVEKAVGLDTPSARTSIPVSAKEAAIQSAQPIEEFTGNVKRGGVFNNTPGQTGYRPVGPKAPPAATVTPTDARLQETMGAAKQAGAERVAAARAASEAAAPIGMAEKVVKPGLVQSGKNVLKGIIPQMTGASLAYELFENPELKAQRDEALQSGMAKIGATTDNVYGLPTKVKASTVAPQPAPTETGKPLTTPATYIAGGVVDQAAPAAQKPQPKQFETTRVPESQTAVSTEPKAPSFTGEQVEGFAQDKGQAVSRGDGGNFRYVQGPNGQVVKQNTDSGEVVPMSVQGITGNISSPGEESPLAREARTRKETAFRDALMRQAFQPIDANTNVADVGTIKRNRLMAQQLLEQMDKNQQSQATLGMEEKKLASTERSTAATQEQNRLAKEADQRYKQDRIGLEERRTKAAEEAAKSKPRTAIYKGQKIQGAPEEIEYEKRQIDTKQASQWDKKNPKPSGMLTTNDDVIKHYEKRARELGYDPDVTSAANLAQRIQGTLQSMSPEDRDEVNRQFQGKYGVPYSEFIVSE